MAELNKLLQALELAIKANNLDDAQALLQMIDKRLTPEQRERARTKDTALGEYLRGQMQNRSSSQEEEPVDKSVNGEQSDKPDEAQIDNIAERVIKFGLPYLPPKSDLKKWAKFVNENKYEIGKQVLTGTTLQFGDEIVAGVRSFVENEPYEKSLKDVRTEMKTFEKEQPEVSTVAQIGGSLIPFLATRGRTPIATLPGAMGTGTAIAGVAGFGAGEGGFVPRLK